MVKLLEKQFIKEQVISKMSGVEQIRSNFTAALSKLQSCSKPLIANLTKLAKENSRSAADIVQTIENRMSRVNSGQKLPVLFLIDSIVKNLKGDYARLFEQNIAYTFTQCFEQETKVDAETFKQLLKVRRTWNSVFSANKLYIMDFLCHQMDSRWPITSPPDSAHSIHVNPKFLSRALTISPQAATTPSSVTSNMLSPSLPVSSASMPGMIFSSLAEPLSDIDSVTHRPLSPPFDISEAQMREQLLMKRKELLQLQTQKVELELLQTKVQLEEKVRQQPVDNCSMKQISNTPEQELLHRAETAKHQTGAVTSILIHNKVLSSSPPVVTTLRRGSRDMLNPSYDATVNSHPSLPLVSEFNRRRKRQVEENVNDRTNMLPARSPPQKIPRDRSINKLDGLFGPGDVDLRRTSTLTRESHMRDAKRCVPGEFSSKHTNSIESDQIDRFEGDRDERLIKWKRPKLENKLQNRMDEDFRIGVFNNRTRELNPFHFPHTVNTTPRNSPCDSFPSPNQDPRNGPIPRWTGRSESASINVWNDFNANRNKLQRQLHAPVPSHVVSGAENPWNPQIVVSPASHEFFQPPQPQSQFQGLNPFNLPTPPAPLKLLDNILPPVSIAELDAVRKDTTGCIPIDTVQRQVRFYGNIAIVLLPGEFRDEPREISFQNNETRCVKIDQDAAQIECMIGEPVAITLDGKKHELQLGAPTRELNIDGDHYEAFFDGPPIRVWIDGYFHKFQLIGAPPRVSIGNAIRYDLLAGAIDLEIDGNSTIIYLDEKPQRLDLGGFPVLLLFTDEFHTVLLNGRPFPANFGGPPLTVHVPGGRTHYLRFPGLSDKIRGAMLEFVKFRQHVFPGRPKSNGMMQGRSGAVSSNRGTFRGRGNRIVRRGKPKRPYQNGSSAFDARNLEETDAVVKRDSETNGEVPTDVNELLDRLMKAGLLPATVDISDKDLCIKGELEEEKQVTTAAGGTETELGEESLSSTSTKVEKERKNVISPLQNIDIQFVKLKERREMLIATITTGIQCASCGLRFPSDQSVIYSQHLQWHFIQNERKKAIAKKALTQRNLQGRQWYHSQSDWKKFSELQDIGVPSAFESSGAEIDPRSAFTSNVYTVLAADYDGAVCPQCNEEFETFFDEQKEEWRLRYAITPSNLEGTVSELYHPICYEDYVSHIQGKSFLSNVTLEEKIVEANTGEKTNTKPEDEDEVLILKEGKPEVEVMELVEDETEDDKKRKLCRLSPTTDIEVEIVNESMIIGKDSDEQHKSSSICRNDDDKNSDNNNNNMSSLDADNTENTKAKPQIIDFSSLNPTDSKNVCNSTNSNTSHSIPNLSRDAMSDVCNSNNDGSNVSVNALSSLSSTEGKLNSPVLVQTAGLDQPQSFKMTSSSSSLLSSSSNKDNNDSMIEPVVTYRSMKFENSTPIVKEEPVEREEIYDDHFSLDATIEAHMELDAEGGAELGDPELVNLGMVTPNVDTVNIDLTDENDNAKAESPIVVPGTLSTLDGNFLLESTEAKTIGSQSSISKSGFRIHIQDAILTIDSIGEQTPPTSNNTTIETSQTHLDSPQSQNDKPNPGTEAQGTRANRAQNEGVSLSGDKIENSTSLVETTNKSKNIVTSTTNDLIANNNNHNNVLTQAKEVESFSTSPKPFSSDSVSNQKQGVEKDSITVSDSHKPDKTKSKPLLKGRDFRNVPPRSSNVKEISGLCIIC